MAKDKSVAGDEVKVQSKGCFWGDADGLWPYCGCGYMKLYVFQFMKCYA